MTVRDKSAVTGKDNLEHLYTLKDFPVFMGCVDTPQEDDFVADMIWDICKDTGIIQLRELPPLEILYTNQHNDGTGKVWQDHYAAFAEFLHEFKPKNILEIGGAHDYIFQNYEKLDPNINWTTVEPNPEHITSEKIKVVKAWFDDKFTINSPVDTVIHSHVFEHMFEPMQFIKHISGFLKKGQRHVFAFPNFLPMLQNKWTNCLNFEHTVFLTEEITDFIMKREGFIVLKKQYYGNAHSIFYATEKGDVPSKLLALPNKYDEYKNLYTDYVNYHLDMVNKLNSLVEKSENPVYLFGAHIFSQTLIQFGLETDSIVSILDNSSIKQGKRLYGTGFTVESPKILKDKGPVNVILKVASYDAEIKKDILENINPEVTFW